MNRITHRITHRSSSRAVILAKLSRSDIVKILPPEILTILSPRTTTFHCCRFVGHTPMSDEDYKKYKARLLENHAKKRPYGYYDVLEIPHKAKTSAIKKAYFKKAKLYHPDAFIDKSTPDLERRAEIARIKFDEITEAYQTLMDLNQRSFYDDHGYASDALKLAELPTIFDYVPKFSIYETEFLADNETTQMEEWMAAQGHSTRDQKVGIKQRLKNAYIELRWGFAYYNFPWNLKVYFSGWVVAIVTIYGMSLLYAKYLQYMTSQLPKGHQSLPVKLNDKWQNDEPRDILHFLGVRQKFQSDQSRGGLYDKPKSSIKREVDPEVPFSKNLYESWKDSSNSNKDRRKEFKEEQKARKLENLRMQRSYYINELDLLREEQEARKTRVVVEGDKKKKSRLEQMKDDDIKYRISEAVKARDEIDAKMEIVRSGEQEKNKVVFPAGY